MFEGFSPRSWSPGHRAHTGVLSPYQKTVGPIAERSDWQHSWGVLMYFFVDLGCFLGWGSNCKSFYTDMFASTNVWEFPWSIRPSTSEIFPPQSQIVRGCSGLGGFNHFQSRSLKSFNISPILWLLQTSHSITYYRIYWIREKGCSNKLLYNQFNPINVIY